MPRLVLERGKHDDDRTVRLLLYDQPITAFNITSIMTVSRKHDLQGSLLSL